MHMEEIILDGFRCTRRARLSVFNLRFKAITVSNGSGKSNVLDAICYVLGIADLLQMRAHNMQGLEYKQGQAGAIKAGVTKDVKASLVGYE